MEVSDGVSIVEIGRQAAHLLIEHLANRGRPERVVLEAELVVAGDARTTDSTLGTVAS